MKFYSEGVSLRLKADTYGEFLQIRYPLTSDIVSIFDPGTLVLPLLALLLLLLVALHLSSCICSLAFVRAALFVLIRACTILDFLKTTTISSNY